MKGHNFFDYLLGFAVFGIGFVCSKSFSSERFSVVNDLNIIDLVSLLLTPILAYIVYSVLDKNKEDRSKEKDLIIKRIDEIYEYIDANYIKTVSNENLNYSSIITSLKRMNMQIKNSKKLLQLANIQIEEIFIDEILSVIKELKDLETNILTNAQVQLLPSNQINPIIVTNGTVNYSNLRLDEIEEKFDELKNKVMGYQFRINRANN